MDISLNIFGRSSKWKTVRKDHLSKHSECAACGRKDNLEVHHIEPYHVNPDRELDPTNLITLCDDYCHFVFGHLMDYRSWNANVVEDCQAYKQKRELRPFNYSFQKQTKGFIYEIFSNLCRAMLKFYIFTKSGNNRPSE